MQGNTRRPSAALLVSLAAVVLAALVWVVFVLTPQGQRLDAAAYGGASWVQVGPWELVDSARSRLVLPAAAVMVAAALAWLAVRRLWWRASVVAVVVLGSTVSIRLLKHDVLVRPDFGFPPDPNSLPSGHAGAMAAGAVALVLAAPTRLRPGLAVAGSWATALVGGAAVAGFQHRPSDVVAAVLVVLAWAAAATVLLGGGAERDPSPRSPGLVVQGAVFALPALASMLLAAVEPDRSVGGLEALIALVGGLAAIVAASSAVFAVMLALLVPGAQELSRRARRETPRSSAGDRWSRSLS